MMRAPEPSGLAGPMPTPAAVPREQLSSIQWFYYSSLTQTVRDRAGSDDDVEPPGQHEQLFCGGGSVHLV